MSDEETIGELHDRLPPNAWMELPEHGIKVMRLKTQAGEHLGDEAGSAPEGVPEQERPHPDDHRAQHPRPDR